MASTLSVWPEPNFSRCKTMRLPGSILHLWVFESLRWPVLELKTFQTLKLFVPLATNAYPPTRQAKLFFILPPVGGPHNLEGAHKGCSLEQSRGLGGFLWPLGVG